MSVGIRIRPEEVLDSFERGQVYGYVKASPGSSYNEIRETLKISNGSANHHLRILEDKGYVRRYKDGRYVRFYPSDYRGELIANPLSGISEEIVSEISRSRGCSQQHLANAMGLRAVTVNYHVHQLRKRGRVRIERIGSRTAVYPTA